MWNEGWLSLSVVRGLVVIVQAVDNCGSQNGHGGRRRAAAMSMPCWGLTALQMLPQGECNSFLKGFHLLMKRARNGLYYCRDSCMLPPRRAGLKQCTRKYDMISIFAGHSAKVYLLSGTEEKYSDLGPTNFLWRAEANNLCLGWEGHDVVAPNACQDQCVIGTLHCLLHSETKTKAPVGVMFMVAHLGLVHPAIYIILLMRSFTNIAYATCQTWLNRRRSWVC